jgi:hypothetical protein
MQNIPCGLTPAELPVREQSHHQNSDFTTSINLFSAPNKKINFSLCSRGRYLRGLSRNATLAEGF